MSKKYLRTSAPSGDSDQMLSRADWLNSSLTHFFWIAKYANYLLVDNEGSDQTVIVQAYLSLRWAYI